MMKTSTGHQSFGEGFRGEVTRAAVAVLRSHGGECPGCGQRVGRALKAMREHAEGCVDLRADAADAC